jgi:hypothetical protein
LDPPPPDLADEGDDDARRKTDAWRQRLMLTRLAAILTIVGLSSLALVIAPAAAGPATGTILIHCGYDHSAPDDPIVFPGRPGASHSHDFFGSRNVDATTTAASLQAESTTCSFKGDHSGYWVPSLLGPSGKLVAPTGMRVYYRGGDRDAAELRRFPPGVKHLQGNSKNTNPSAYAATYRCDSGALTGPYIPDSCANNSGFEASYYFPFCATGETDNATHKTLIGTTTPCPQPQLSVLQIQMIVSYPPEAVGGRLVSDELAGAKGGLTSHADFFDGWSAEALDMVLDQCIRANADCKVGEDGGVYRSGTNAVAIPAGTFTDPPCETPTVCPATGPVRHPETSSPQAPEARRDDAPTAAATSGAGVDAEPPAAALRTTVVALAQRLAAIDPRRLGRKRLIASAVTFPSAGRLTLTWRLVKPRAASANKPSKRPVVGRGSLARDSAGCAQIRVQLTVEGRRLLRRVGAVRIALEATFRPAGGGRPTSVDRTVTLRRHPRPTP